MNKFMKKLGVLCLGAITALGVGITSGKRERAANALAGSFTIAVGNFSDATTAYGDRNWSSDSTIGDKITGKATMLAATSTNLGTMQTNNSTPMWRNIVEVPGSITKITIDSKTTKVFTVRVSASTAISSTGAGVAAGSGTLSVTGGTPASITVTGNYRYFYIQNASGATYTNSIKIEYEKITTVAEQVTAFDAKVTAALNAGVTANSKATVEALELEFEGLDTEVKALVNTTNLIELRTLFDAAVAAAVQLAAETFIGKIDTLAGSITTSSGPAITALETEYLGLSETVKDLVDGMDYATKMADLKSKLDTTINLAAQQLANTFISKVDALAGNITATSGTAISAIETEYAGLAASVKTLVDDQGYAVKIAGLKSDLTLALAAADKAAADAVILLISNLPEISAVQLSHAEQITTARNAYKELTVNQQDLVSNIEILVAIEARMLELDPRPSAVEVYNKSMSTLTVFAENSSESVVYAKGPYVLTDSTTTVASGSAASLTWIQNGGQKNGSDMYLGANAASVDKMIITDSRFAGMKAPLAAAGDSNSRIAMIRMGNFYVDKPTDIQVGFTNFNNPQTTTKIYLVASTNTGSTWSILTTLTSVSASTEKIGWSGLDYVNTYGVQFAVVVTSSAYFTLRNIAPVIKGLGGAVTTVASQSVKVSGVSLNKESLQLDVGETQAIVVGVAPQNADDVTYSLNSSDESVATVDSATNIITAVGIGSATITAITTDGGFTATCDVTVSGSSDLKFEFTSAITGSKINVGGLDFEVNVEGHGEEVYYGYPVGGAKGAQIGAGTTVGVVTLRTKVARFNPEEINKIAVNASNSSSTGSAKLKVMIGSTQIGEEVTLTNTATTYTFENSILKAMKKAAGEDLGRLEIIATGNGVCFKSIAIYGGSDSIALAKSGDLQNFINSLEEADTCEDYDEAVYLRGLFNELGGDEQALANVQTYMADGDIEANLMDKLAYMEELDLNGGSVSQSSSPLLIIGNENAMTLIAIIAVIGLSAIGAYYFLNKKKYAA